MRSRYEGASGQAARTQGHTNPDRYGSGVGGATTTSTFDPPGPSAHVTAWTYPFRPAPSTQRAEVHLSPPGFSPLDQHLRPSKCTVSPPGLCKYRYWRRGPTGAQAERPEQRPGTASSCRASGMSKRAADPATPRHPCPEAKALEQRSGTRQRVPRPPKQPQG